MIKFINTTKKYGSMAAIDRINLSITENGIYCLLGRNGAGKTTMMKLLSGHITPTEGEITVNGKFLHNSAPEGVNFIESHSSHFNMSVMALVEASAALQESFDIDFAKEMIKLFELNPNKKYKGLSFGMKTMLSTILTLANNSKIILLDEPTLGFDAIMRDQFNTLLLESYSSHPRIIIVSTHQIDEIAKVTERLIIIDKGKVLLEAGIEDIDEKAYSLSGPSESVLPLIAKLNCINKTVMGNVMSASVFDKRVSVPDGVVINKLSLQDFFINIVGGNKK